MIHFSSDHYYKPKCSRPLQEIKTIPPFAAFEIGDGQEESVVSIFKDSGWQNIQIKPDINGLSRVLVADLHAH